jgi:multiple sugar transport system permease protein
MSKLIKNKKANTKHGHKGEILKGDVLIASVFLFPIFLFLVALFFYPLIQTLWLSFTSFSSFREPQRFVGLENYILSIRDRIFRTLAVNTMILTFFVVFIDFLVGLGAALLLNQKFKGRGVIRALTVLPWAMPGVVVGYLWRFMFNPELGLVNAFLFSISAIKNYIVWLDNPLLAMFVLIISYVWKGSPFFIIIYLAALQTVPEELLDAAMIDGAGFWQKLKHIILPHISPVVSITILLATFWTFNYFELVWVITGGGPYDSTHIFPTYIYQSAFLWRAFGKASALAIIDSIMLLSFGILFIWIRKVKIW